MLNNLKQVKVLFLENIKYLTVQKIEDRKLCLKNMHSLIKFILLIENKIYKISFARWNSTTLQYSLVKTWRFGLKSSAKFVSSFE